MPAPYELPTSAASNHHRRCHGKARPEPHGQARPGSGILRVDASGGPFNLGDTLFAGFGLGVGYGFLDDLETGAVLVPAVVAPDAGFGDMRLYTAYRLTRGTVELGLHADLVFPTGQPQASDTDFAASLSLPLQIRAGPRVLVQTGLELSVLLLGGERLFAFASPTRFSFPSQRHPTWRSSGAGLPLLVTVSATDRFFVALRSGVGVETVEAFGDTVFVPLGAEAGVSSPVGASGVIDITVRFQWPELYARWENQLQTDVWELLLTVGWHLPAPSTRGQTTGVASTKALSTALPAASPPE